MPVEGTMAMQSGEIDEFGHVRLGGIGNRLAPRRSSRAPASRRGSSSSATCCAAAPRPRSTACSRPASGSRRSTRSHEGDFGTMVALRGTDIVRVPIADGVERAQDASTPAFEADGSSSGEAAHGHALDDLHRPARARTARGQPLPRREPRRGPPAVFGGQVAAQALVAAGRTVDGDGRCTRCTPTSCGPAIRRSRSSTRSTASATGERSPPGASSRSSTGGDLQPRGVVPDRRARARPPVPDAGRAGARGRCRRSASGSSRTCDRFAPEMVEWLERERPIDSRPVEAPRWLDPGDRASRRSTCGSAPTGSCPTTRCCTRASSRTRRTSRCSTPR